MLHHFDILVDMYRESESREEVQDVQADQP